MTLDLVEALLAYLRCHPIRTLEQPIYTTPLGVWTW